MKLKTPNKFEIEGLKSIAENLIEELVGEENTSEFVYSNNAYHVTRECICYSWDTDYSITSFGISPTNNLIIEFDYIKDRNTDITEEEGETKRFFIDFARFYDSPPSEYLKEMRS